MIILFKYQERSFLPEVFAYKQFFEKMGVQVITNKSQPDIKPDVCWELMGLHISRSAPATVHIDEYSSASTPPLRTVKDTLKKWLNRKPDYRLFLNPYVNDSFSFNDRIPYGYRDMGVSLVKSSLPPNKTYDFIYTGSVDKLRKINLLLKSFSRGNMKDRNILILSKGYAALQAAYTEFKNIVFAGPCQPSEVPKFLQQAKYGINFIPDEEPFNRQTSTKLLEYAAADLPIITTDYYWVKDFEKKYGGRFFYLDKDLANFQQEYIEGFKFMTPDISGWTWENQILNSGVLQFLERKFPGFLSEHRRSV